MKLTLFLTLSLIALFCGCGSVNTTQEQVSTPAKMLAPNGKVSDSARPLETYIGGQIFKIDHTRPLPNAFGGADIFGRKIYAGFTELRYFGLTSDGKIILRITDVET